MVVNNLGNETTRLMRDGQAAAKRGDKALARALLTQLLERDPHNEQAWVWLSGAVTDPQEQQTCLENALIINPGNTQARKGLQAVSSRTGVSAGCSTSTPAPSPAVTASSRVRRRPSTTSPQTSIRNIRTYTTHTSAAITSSTTADALP